MFVSLPHVIGLLSPVSLAPFASPLSGPNSTGHAHLLGGARRSKMRGLFGLYGAARTVECRWPALDVSMTINQD